MLVGFRMLVALGLCGGESVREYRPTFWATYRRPTAVAEVLAPAPAKP
ncbi:hypothetical protein [Hymenobacter sp.]|nr:hypothetical protein [Hymenobacter sp.]